MTDTIYVASVHDRRSAMSRDHPTMRAAFAWLKQTIASDRTRWTYGDVWMGGRTLVTYTAQRTEWHGDGFERWESGE